MLSQLPQYDINPDYAKKCLEANKHNNITTTYYLLVKKLITQGKKGIMDPNRSFENKKFNNSMPRIEPEKKLGESMRIDCNKSCNMYESFEGQRRESEGTAYQKHMATGLGYSTTKAGAKCDSLNLGPSTAVRGKDKKSNSFITDEDLIGYQKQSNHKKNAPKTPENIFAQSQQRKNSANRRKVSCRDRAVTRDRNERQHNKSAMQYDEETTKTNCSRSGKQDWSYELLTECTGNGNLQKLYDLYQQQMYPSMPMHNATTTVFGADSSNSFKAQFGKVTNLHPLKALDEERFHINPPSQQHATRHSHREDAGHAKRAIAKSTSPCHNAHIDTELRTMIRPIASRKTKESAKEQHKINLLDEKSLLSDTNKKTQPITIIQAPQINNINNYNNIHIGNISINQPGASQPAPPVVPAPSVSKVNKFRSRKYKASNNNDISIIQKENSKNE